MSKRITKKEITSSKNKAQFMNKLDSRNLFVKFLVFSLIVGLNWIGISAVGNTLAYFNDTEVSPDNYFQAGILDFELISSTDFSPSSIDINESATRIINIVNLGNQHKYTITADDFSAEICDHLHLEASLNSGDIEYSGLLKDFIDFGPTVFEDPAEWLFTLTLLSGAPESVLGQTCGFDFIFFGSQTRHGLPLGKGFTNTEQISNSLSTEYEGPEITLTYPNGGEEWWVGRSYDITWTTNNLNCLNDSSEVDLYYSADSGSSWANIVEGADDNGTYNWQVPLFLNGYYVPSNRARIKVVVICSENGEEAGWDMSDEDFCPPIDYDLLTPEEIEMLIDLGIITGDVDAGTGEDEEAGSTSGNENEEFSEENDEDDIIDNEESNNEEIDDEEVDDEENNNGEESEEGEEIQDDQEEDLESEEAPGKESEPVDLLEEVSEESEPRKNNDDDIKEEEVEEDEDDDIENDNNNENEDE